MAASAALQAAISPPRCARVVWSSVTLPKRISPAPPCESRCTASMPLRPASTWPMRAMPSSPAPISMISIARPWACSRVRASISAARLATPASMNNSSRSDVWVLATTLAALVAGSTKPPFGSSKRCSGLSTGVATGISPAVRSAEYRMRGSSGSMSGRSIERRGRFRNHHMAGECALQVRLRGGVWLSPAGARAPADRWRRCAAAVLRPARAACAVLARGRRRCR